MGRFKSFDEFLDLFPTKTRERIKTGYNVLCPAHDDHSPSLSVTLDDYKILLYCQADCQTSQILASLNLSEGDLFLANSAMPSRVEATHPYHSETGQLLYEIVRYNPKTFKARRPAGSGKWVWNLQGVRTVLYHLPDILRAIATDEIIYITEGERDCDRLWEIGLRATTNPFGAGKWKGHYSESLRGAKVIIVPDNDDEGRRHAISVIRSLEGTAKTLAVAEIPDTANDVAEWLDQGHSREHFLSLKTTAPNEYTGVYTCSRGGDLASNRTKGAQKTHNFGIEDIREYIRSQDFKYWDVKYLDYELGILDAAAKHYRRRSISLLQESKEIEQHPTDGRKYRQISPNDAIDYKSVALCRPLEVWLPFDIHKHFSTYPGNLLTFAGVTDSGKTALAVNIIRNNDDNWTIDYWTNEVSAEELSERLQSIEPTKHIRDWNFDARVIQPGYLQKIRPDILSIFDYIDVGDPYYRIAEEQQAIHDAIGRGVAIIFLQKDESRILARGRAFSAQLPRLYISMDMKTAYAYKAKTPKSPNNPLKGKSCEFKLRNGVHFKFGEWLYKAD